MSENKKKGVTFNPWMEVTTGSTRNAYSRRGNHNNRASRAQLAQQFAQAGMQRSKKANNIAYVNEFANVMNGMRRLTLGRGGKRSSRRRSNHRRQTRRRR